MLSRKFFEDDPFFASHQEHMRQMEKMFRDPFAGFDRLLSIEGPSDRHGRADDRQRGGRRGDELAPRSLFDFGGFGNMFQSMHGMMEDMQKKFNEGAPSSHDGHMYTHSSFASYSNVGEGQPKVFQASSSSMQGPGKVRETRKTLRDSETGVEKMAVGHHIGDRGHVVQRQRNRRTGKEEENQEYLNLEEGRAEEFDREWQECTRDMRQMYNYKGRGSNERRVEDRHQRPKHKSLGFRD